MLRVLNMPATLPVTTGVLIGRVASMPSKCDKDTGSNLINGMFGERNMDRGSYPSNVRPLKMLSLYLKARYLHLIATIGKEHGNQCPGNITFAKNAGHSASHYTCIDWHSGQHA